MHKKFLADRINDSFQPIQLFATLLIPMDMYFIQLSFHQLIWLIVLSTRRHQLQANGSHNYLYTKAVLQTHVQFKYHHTRIQIKC